MSGVDQRDAKPANLVGNDGASLAAASTDAKAVEQVKTMVANGMVAAGGGNLAAGRGLMSQNGVVKLIYKKR